MFYWNSALGAVALGGKVYICGGFDGTSSLNSVEIYDPETDEWTMISSMEKHRSASGVVVVDGQIYAIGGHDGLSIFDSVCLCLSISCKAYTWLLPRPFVDDLLLRFMNDAMKSRPLMVLIS